MTRTEQIKEHEQRMVSAVINTNFEELDQLLHDDLLFVIPNGQTITKAMDMEHFRSRKIKIEEMIVRDMTINMIGDNAVVSVAYTLKGQYNNEAFEGKFRYMRVWQFFGDTWKVIGGSGMQLSLSE